MPGPIVQAPIWLPYQRFPHANGGCIEIRRKQAVFDVQMNILFKGDGDDEDLIEIRKFITDDSGRQHVLTSVFYTEDIWDAWCRGVTYSEKDFYNIIYPKPKRENMTLIHQGLHFYSDDRDFQSFIHRKTPYDDLNGVGLLAAVVSVKHLSFSCDLYFLSYDQEPSGAITTPHLVAVITASQLFKSVKGVDFGDPIYVLMEQNELLMKNHIKSNHTLVDPDDLEKYRLPVPVFYETGETGLPTSYVSRSSHSWNPLDVPWSSLWSSDEYDDSYTSRNPIKYNIEP